MKLYYTAGACSLSPHIVLREAGLAFDLVPADLKTHTLADGSDYYAVNPKGYVPLLELDDGTRLTEGPVIVQYVADQVPEKRLAPPAGTMERYRLQEWLNFTTSELHKGIGALFNPALPDAARTMFRDRAAGRLKWVDGQLGAKPYLMGDFSVADAYLFVILTWTQHVGIDISAHETLTAYQARVAARPGVQAALKAEGLSS